MSRSVDLGRARRSMAAASVAVAVAIGSGVACNAILGVEELPAGDTAGDAGDEQVTDAGVGDAPAEAARCNPSSPFGVPVLVAPPQDGGINTSSDETGGRLSHDELSLYFARKNPSALSTIFVAVRPSPTSPFSAPVGIALGGGDWSSPYLLADNLTLFVVSTGCTASGCRPPQGSCSTPQQCCSGICTAQACGDCAQGTGLFVSTRVSTSSPYGMPMVLPILGMDVTDVAFLPNETTVYLTKGNHIYASADTQSSFSTPVLAPGLESVTGSHPVVAANDLAIFFASPRATAGDDVLVATRAQASAPFGTAISLPALNSPKDDHPTWLSVDGCVLLIESNRNGGQADLFVATRSP